MPVSRRGAATTIAAALVLFAGSTLGSYAANGGPLLLGKSNTASKTTKLKTTGNGAALKLKSKAGKAPLKVSNRTKIAKLNADLVDGLDGAALQTKSYVYDLTAIAVPNTYIQFALPGLPAGRYVVDYSLVAGAIGSPTLFGCYLITGTGGSAVVSAAEIGTENNTGDWFVTGSGYVDTTAATSRFVCQRNGGTSATIPVASTHPARLVLTRVDDVAGAGSTGVGSAAPRGITP